MKATVLPRDKVVKIRYSKDDQLLELLELLSIVPDMEVIDRGYRM